jgi:hypothetical protein
MDGIRAPRRVQATRDRSVKPKRRPHLELIALESREVLSTLTGFNYVEQQAFPAPQTTVTSNPTAFQDQLNQSWAKIASGQQLIGSPQQTLSQLITSSVQAASKAQKTSAYNISEGFAAKGDYSATLDTTGANPVLKIQYHLGGNSLSFTNTTNSILGSYADPTFHVTYDLTINLNLTFATNLTQPNPVSVTANASVGNVNVTSKNVLVAVADFFGSNITGQIANGLNGHSVDLSNTVASSTSTLNAGLSLEAFRGYTHLQVGLDGSGNLLLTAQKPDLVINGTPNDHIVVANGPNGSLQVTEGGQVATFGAGYLHSITINTASGQNSVQVLGTPTGVPLTLNDGATSTDAVTIGNGSLAGLGGAVNVNSNTSTKTTVTVNDSADATNRLTTITNNSVQTSGLPTVNYSGTGVAGLNFISGTGYDGVFVYSTAANAPVNLTVGGGQDTVFVGDNGSLAGIAGAVNVQHGNNSGKTGLVVDDYAESGRNATITSSSVSFTGIPTITYGGLSSLEVVGASGNNTITVNSVPALVPVTIYNTLHNKVTGPAASAVTTYLSIPVSDLISIGTIHNNL